MLSITNRQNLFFLIIYTRTSFIFCMWYFGMKKLVTALIKNKDEMSYFFLQKNVSQSLCNKPQCKPTACQAGPRALVFVLWSDTCLSHWFINWGVRWSSKILGSWDRLRWQLELSSQNLKRKLSSTYPCYPCLLSPVSPPPCHQISQSDENKGWGLLPQTALQELSSTLCDLGEWAQVPGGQHIWM